MGAPFQKVQQGEPIQHIAVEHNAFVDAAVAHKANQYGFDQTPSERFPQLTIVKARNDTQSDRDQFEIGGLKEPIVKPEENENEFAKEATFTAVTPAVSNACATTPATRE